MDNNFENRLQAIEYELSQVAESEYLDELRKKFTADENIGVVVNILTPKNIVFKTRSLLSQILNRLELTYQDRLDLEKYIIYGGGDNIEYIKQTLAIWVEWKDKILNIIKDAPEEFDTLIEIFNYINKHIEECNIKLENIPFEKGDADNSAVLKGGNNQVISEGGVALGGNNLVGLKGFYYKHIRFVSSTLANIYLSKTQVIPTITTGGELKDTTVKPTEYLSKGDIISIVNDNKYNDIAEIHNMSDGMIQIKWLSKAPFESIKKETNLSPEDYSIYCLDKPTQGISDLGKYSFANGTDNKAINAYAEVSGKGNIAKGKFAKVWGKDNVGGYNTTTFGTKNINLADNSLVNGTNNINEGNNSVIHGNKNKNYGKRAFVTGNENITNNENETAFGQYNKSNSDTQFSIGIGTSDTDRKNAVEVKVNGDIYIEGVGGYDGTNPENSTDLATAIVNVGNRKIDFYKDIDNNPIGYNTSDGLIYDYDGGIVEVNLGQLPESYYGKVLVICENKKPKLYEINDIKGDKNNAVSIEVPVYFYINYLNEIIVFSTGNYRKMHIEFKPCTSRKKLPLEFESQYIVGNKTQEELNEFYNISNSNFCGIGSFSFNGYNSLIINITPTFSGNAILYLFDYRSKLKVTRVGGANGQNLKELITLNKTDESLIVEDISDSVFPSQGSSENNNNILKLLVDENGTSEESKQTLLKLKEEIEIDGNISKMVYIRDSIRDYDVLGYTQTILQNNILIVIRGIRYNYINGSFNTGHIIYAVDYDGKLIISAENPSDYELYCTKTSSPLNRNDYITKLKTLIDTSLDANCSNRKNNQGIYQYPLMFYYKQDVNEVVMPYYDYESPCLQWITGRAIANCFGQFVSFVNGTINKCVPAKIINDTHYGTTYLEWEDDDNYYSLLVDNTNKTPKIIPKKFVLDFNTCNEYQQSSVSDDTLHGEIGLTPIVIENLKNGKTIPYIYYCEEECICKFSTVGDSLDFYIGNPLADFGVDILVDIDTNNNHIEIYEL